MKNQKLALKPTASFLVAIIIMLACALPVNAAGLQGYNAVWGKKSATFSVITTGSNKSTGYVTVRVRNASKKASAHNQVRFNIKRPNGTYIFSIFRTVNMDGNEWKYSFSNAPKGTYTVIFDNFGGVNTVDFLCWIYG